MRIVHCIWSFCTGGAETMLIDIANEQAKTQQVYVLIVNDAYQQCLIDRFSPAVKVIFNRRKSGSRSPLPLIRLNRTLFSLRPDVVHFHSIEMPKVVSRRVSRGLFGTVHALQLPVEAVRRVKLLAISEAVREDVLKRGKFDIRTIPNGINVDSIARRQLRDLDGKMRIVQVARLDADKKGQDILIDAVALLHNKGIRNVELDLIGEGASMEELKAQAEKSGVSDRVHFLGLRDRAYIYAHLQDYDLMCHPARYEGFGLTVAEGMAAMLPILVPDEGGPYEVIDSGRLGTAFKMEDASDCADKIEHILNHYQEALSLVEAAYERVVEQYSLERMVADYIEYYKTTTAH